MAHGPMMTGSLGNPGAPYFAKQGPNQCTHVAVYFAGPGWTTEKRMVKEAIDNSWGSKYISRIHFTWFGIDDYDLSSYTTYRTIPSSEYRNRITVSITATEDRDAARPFYIRSDPPQIQLDFLHPERWGVMDGHTNMALVNTNSTTMREHCIKAIAVHEFGHALGFAHEQKRVDLPPCCRALFDPKDPQSQEDDSLYPYTSFDPNSVMYYAQPPALEGKLSAKDIESVQTAYGSPCNGRCSGPSPRGGVVLVSLNYSTINPRSGCCIS